MYQDFLVESNYCLAVIFVHAKTAIILLQNEFQMNRKSVKAVNEVPNHPHL